jgi:hypothetical protein
MRIPKDHIESLRLSLILEIASLYQNKNVDLLYKILRLMNKLSKRRQ